MSDLAGQETTTGRYLVLLPEERHDAGVALVAETAGLELRAADPAKPTAAPWGDNGVVYRQLGVAVLPEPPQATVAALQDAAADAAQPVLAVEPERWAWATAVPSAIGWVDDGVATWGMHATGAAASALDGSGIGVAVLDTGIDLAHPDFAGREVVTASFVRDEPVDDGHGHGTHCAGVACGTASPSAPPVYGVAHGADLHVGKVLANSGRGADGDIIAGIAWALDHGCRIVSMSLESPVPFGAPHSAVYEQLAQRALRQGTVIFAAAGNGSNRAAGRVNPVSQPADCPSVFAVAAIDRDAGIASFSNGSDPDGGQVDVAGPGVDVRSTWPQPTAYNTISGTSMATPFVAGIAALHAQAGALSGPALVNAVLGSGIALPGLGTGDVGRGLVQAP
jgi:subtilisin